MAATKKIRLIRILCVFVIALLAFSALSAPAQAVPKIKAGITRKNVLSLAKKYDADGYYLLRAGNNAGGQGFMDYFHGPVIIANLDTAVHEMCHANTHNVYGFQEKIYKGKKKFITVNFSDKMKVLFKTKTMASSVPKKYRTFRFKTYISKPIPYLTSNIFGCYGLLDEFTAYCWGMNDTVSLFPYYKAKAGANFNYWKYFINLGANDRLAYAEFRYYILHYLAFAKAKHPAAYKAIMNDATFRKAFRTIDKKFRSNIKKYHKDLQKLVNILNSRGHSSRIVGDYFYCDGFGIGMFTKDYNKLMKQIKKGKYKGTSYESIYKRLIK